MKYLKILLVVTLSCTVYCHIQPSSNDWRPFCEYGKQLGSPETFGKHSMLSFEPSISFDSSGFPGLSMCTINQRSGKVLFYGEFPLYEIYAVWKDLERHFINISPERIVVLTLHGESVKGLRNVTELFASYGSVFIQHLDIYAIWTWAFVFNGKSIFEKVTYARNEEQELISFSHLFIPLSNLHTLSSYYELENERWRFCDEYGIMGDVCDESKPAVLDLSYLDQRENALLQSVPVIITAGGRTSYLYQSLKSYFKSWGIVKKNLHVLLGSDSRKARKLLRLFNITSTYIPPSQYGKEDFFSFLYYKEVYKYVYKHFKHSHFAIFLEEDIEISLDFFSYISQTMHLLDEDPTLYCVTGHSTSGLEYLSHDETTLMRGAVQVGWGYILTLDYIEEALQYWPVKNILPNLVYDGWMYYYIAGERECVFPEVSRTHHFGVGLNTVFWLTEVSFFSTPMVKPTEVIKFDVERLNLPIWKKDLRSKLSKAVPVRESPCKPNYVQSLVPGSYVMFYNYSIDDNSTNFNYAFIAVCFRGWMYSYQGQHESVAILRIAKNILFYLVGVPASSYSYLKPKNYSIIDIRSEPFEEKNEYIRVYNYVHNLFYIKLRNLTRDLITDTLFT